MFRVLALRPFAKPNFHSLSDAAPLFLKKLEFCSLLAISVFIHVKIRSNYLKKHFALKEKLMRTRKWSVHTTHLYLGKLLLSSSLSSSTFSSFIE